MGADNVILLRDAGRRQLVDSVEGFHPPVEGSDCGRVEVWCLDCESVFVVVDADCFLSDLAAYLQERRMGEASAAYTDWTARNESKAVYSVAKFRRQHEYASRGIDSVSVVRGRIGGQVLLLLTLHLLVTVLDNGVNLDGVNLASHGLLVMLHVAGLAKSLS